MASAEVSETTPQEAGAPESAQTLLAAVGGCWALLFGMGLVMLGNGLQGSLLGLRATLEGFSTAVTGLVMSGYFAGFAAGSFLVPRLVARVGHVRVFAALASLASVVALLHVVIITPATWGALRLVTGFCYAGLYIVAESWLNDAVSNEKRGRMLSLYMVISLGGMASGPLLLNLDGPSGFLLFILASVLVSLALVPILLSVGRAPRFGVNAKMRLREIYLLSPLAIIGCFGVGIANGALVGVGVVYAEQIGLSVPQISLFIGLSVMGGVVLQWPIGYLSDSFDRRWVMTVVSFAAAICAYAAIAAVGGAVWIQQALVFLFGGLSFPLYSLSLAHANDRLEPQQMVAASSALVLVTGAGAAFGPVTAGVAMSLIGPSGFYWYLAGVHTALGLFALYRMTRRAAVPLEEQVPSVYLSRTSAVAAAAAMESARIQMEADEDQETEAASG